MHPAGGPICELELTVGHDRRAALLEALVPWVTLRLALPGVRDARILAAEDPDDDRARISAVFVLDDDAALEEHFREAVDSLRDALPAELLDDATIEQRNLHAGLERQLERPRCANCEAPLSGQYCGECGQRAQDRFISLWELVRDAAGDLFELDSRLWRTLIPLAVRPGKLTADYLEGRRARYMPPFRSYLVLSLLFFVVAFFDPQQEFRLLLEPPPSAAAVEPAAGTADTRAAPAEPSAAGGSPGVQCEVDAADFTDMPPWLSSWLTPERAEYICEQVEFNSRGFVDRMLDNVAIALYLLLPLMALVLKLLYPFSRRYYVEHLLFVVNLHAFFFLAIIVQLALRALVEVSGISAAAFLLAGVPVYAAIYPYKALRRVYVQGRLATLFKYLLLFLAYLTSFAIMMAIAAAIAAISL